jgi:eukaryotic-like serine/threonine-protein kinase
MRAEGSPMSAKCLDEQAIFEVARKIGSREAREVYLQQVCDDDAAIAQRIRALVKAYEENASFLESPAAASPESVNAPNVAEAPGTMIGPYKLLQQIGEGGMGAVFMAEQTQPVQRKVALKIIKAGMDSRQVIARFEAERQALAKMDHVNISRVLDAGTTESGLPYFVMELVHGVPITKYCDDNRLTPRERLELFVPVCQAIQHAHQKGIIHRDIKPSNVMIALYDGKPAPKVIDFGIAKATGQRLTDKTLFTEFGAVVGTVEYMSPEQAELNNHDIDTRSDIYSLGAMLYELLTGTTPLEHKRLTEKGVIEALRIIREEETPCPSARLSTVKELASISAQRHTEPAKLTKLMRGELDWIVLRALEKDRRRRYESASALAADVQRYLNDEAVEACPPSAGYRLRKSVRRNKGLVLAVATSLVVLVGGVIGTTIGLVQADQARQLAETNEHKALTAAAAEKEAKETAQTREAETLAVLDFVENRVFAAARPRGQGRGLAHDVTIRRAVETALPFVDLSFTKQPLIEARLRWTLGISFWYLGDAKIAAEQFQAARMIYTKYLGPDHPDTLRSMHNLANSYATLGRHADALKLREETLALMKAKLGPDHPDTLKSMHNLASSYADFGRHTDALKLFEETLTLMKARLGPDHPNTLSSMHRVASSYEALGRHADALKLHEETLALQKAMLGPDHPDTLDSMTNLAISYAALGRHADALKLREETLALMKATLPDHPDTLKSTYNLASSYATLGRHADALKLFEETLVLMKAKLGTDHPDTLKSMRGMAAILVALNRGAEAVPIIDDCVQRTAGKVVDPGLVPAMMDLRLRHFEKTRNAAGCRATAEMWEKLLRSDTGSLYTAAKMRAVTVAVIKEDPKTPSADAARLAKEEADHAMAWLTQAVAAGYNDVARMKTDRNLDALRDRPDLQKLLAELEAKHKESRVRNQAPDKKPMHN